MNRRVIMARARSGLEIDEIALRVVKLAQPDMLTRLGPFDMQRFFDNKLEALTNVTPDYRELNFNAHGFTDMNEMECVISKAISDDASQIRFLRSTQAHESGHCFIHVPEFKRRKESLRFIHDTEHVTLRLHREDEVKIFRNPEWQAWRFAGALLMPASSVQMAMDENYSAYDMGEVFEVNIPFVWTRLRALKLDHKVKAF